MSKPYDAVSKRLIEMPPADWVALLRLPSGTVSLIDADLSTVTNYADRIIRVDADAGASYLMHNELESGEKAREVSAKGLNRQGDDQQKQRVLKQVGTSRLPLPGKTPPRTNIVGAFD